jgi:hypothetical protein
VPARWKGRSEKRLVVAVGHNDAVNCMTTARVRLNLANILDDAAASGIARSRWDRRRRWTES